MVFEGVKDFVLEKCRVNETAFEVIAERSLPMGDGKEGKQRQTEVLDLDPESVGKDIRMLRLRILSGYKDFAAIFNVDAIGEESEQQMVVLESRPEVNL
ncbi:hypothetical protein STCU_00046 [Strigomonas culicis]|nr:hypothetical protein STCU_00046 [Strigomonas culicis]|eukprot:EPY37251.1 hypothetical protein STCU_00046 [Strigomonas culicis]